ncbi:MAG TPA: aldo/keto reductase [Dehalococcoidia bacterium]|nr:aldo/keto reductase [Dehalococcoidia bacterium]
MDFRSVGRSGLQVSAIGLGTNNFGMRCDEEQSRAVVQKALESGITFFDTADIYGNQGLSEEYLGRALKDVRQDVIIGTKFSGPMGEGPLKRGGARRYIRQAVIASLRRLGTDYIDLYQMHYPDPLTPVEESLRALEDLIREGLVLYIGCSNYTPAQFVEAQLVARAEHLDPFVSAQNHYNLLNRDVEQELLSLCSRYGAGFIPYFPLAAGFLTGKYHRGQPAPEGARLSGGSPFAQRVLTDTNYDLLEKLEAFTQQAGHTINELAIAWLASQPGVCSVIAGSTRPEQVEANVRAAEWRLSEDELREVRSILTPNGN